MHLWLSTCGFSASVALGAWIRCIPGYHHLDLVHSWLSVRGFGASVALGVWICPVAVTRSGADENSDTGPICTWRLAFPAIEVADFSRVHLQVCAKPLPRLGVSARPCLPSFPPSLLPARPVTSALCGVPLGP